VIIYLALAAYLVTFILAVLLFVAGKDNNALWRKVFLTIHFLFLLCFVLSLLIKTEASAFRYSFLLFVCSGLVTGGFILRSTQLILPKIYFSVFFLTLGYFLYSPSGFARFLLTANPYSQSAKNFHLRNNYYLERQSSIAISNQQEHPYKLVQQFGLFHKTIRRDIFLTADPDSVKVLEWKDKEALVLRTYHFSESTHGLVIDSTDVQLSLRKEVTKNQIERRF